MARGLGNPITHGRTLPEATAALIKLIDPNVEPAPSMNVEGKARAAATYQAGREAPT